MAGGYPTPFLLGQGHLVPLPRRPRQRANDWFPGDRTALLADGCGQPGCDALLAGITDDDDSVLWPSLSLLSRPGQSIALGPFRFGRAAYDREIQRVRDLIGG